MISLSKTKYEVTVSKSLNEILTSQEISTTILILTALVQYYIRKTVEIKLLVNIFQVIGLGFNSLVGNIFICLCMAEKVGDYSCL